MDTLIKDTRSIMAAQGGYTVNISRNMLQELCDRLEPIVEQRKEEVVVVSEQLAATRNDENPYELSTDQLIQLMRNKVDFAVLTTEDGMFRVADEAIAPLSQGVKGEAFHLIRGFVHYPHDGKSKHLRLDVSVDLDQLQQNGFFPERAVSILVGIKTIEATKFIEMQDKTRTTPEQSYSVGFRLPEGKDASLYVYTYPKGRA